MAKLEVAWTETALRQRDLIFGYWNERSGSTNYSKKLLKKINEQTAYLSEFPQMSKTTEVGSTRVASLGHFSIYYQIKDRYILVTAFWDNRDDPDKLLEQLKK